MLYQITAHLNWSYTRNYIYLFIYDLWKTGEQEGSIWTSHSISSFMQSEGFFSSFGADLINDH